MEHMFNGTFWAEKQKVEWVPQGMHRPILFFISINVPAGDGVYTILKDDAIKLVDLKTNTTKILLSRYDVRDVRRI